MPTTITPVGSQSPIPTNGPVNSLPLPTSIVTTAAVAPAPHLVAYIENGQECFRVIAALQKNTRPLDTIWFSLKSNTQPTKIFNFGGGLVDGYFENREIINNNGLCISSYPIDNMKNMGVTNGTYRLTVTQKNSTGTTVVSSLTNSYSITV